MPLHPLITRRHAVTALAASAALPAFAQSGAGLIKVRLLETTDIHVALLSYDYYQDRPDDTMGLAKVATLIDLARASARNSLLFDNGDFLQGNPLGDLIAYERGLKEGDVHPVMRALNALEIDAGTLGNHEFNYGLPFLEKALAGARYPLVCANIFKGAPAATARGDATFLKPYRILERSMLDEAGIAHALRIGVIGFVPPQIMQWDFANLNGRVDTRDIVETAMAFVPEMREQCDLVIALCHSGIGDDKPQGKDENAALQLAHVPGIDAIFTGHAHLEFPGRSFAGRERIDNTKGLLNGVPAVMAGFWGSHLGQIDLVLQKDGRSVRVIDSQSLLLPIYKRENGKVVALAEPKAAIVATVAPDHAAALAYIRKPVGRTARPLSTFFALVSNSDALQLVADAQLWYARPLLAGGPYATLPLLSAVAPFKAGGRGGADAYTSLMPGEVALKNAADLYVFPNILKGVRVTGAQLADWLERSAGQFNQLRVSDDEQQLIDVSFPSYNFDVIVGVTYAIDLSQPSKFGGADGKPIHPEALRIRDLRYRGAPVKPDDAFVVITNNYRAGGGGNFAGADGKSIVLDAPDPNRDVLIRYMSDARTVDPSAVATWHFQPVPGATNVVFESSPKAKDIAGQIKGVSYIGDGANGFARYRLRIDT